MLGITLVASDRSKPGVDEGSWMVLSGGSFEITWIINLEDEGTGEGDTMDN